MLFTSFNTNIGLHCNLYDPLERPQSRPHWYPSPRPASPRVQCKHAHLYRSASAPSWMTRCRPRPLRPSPPSPASRPARQYHRPASHAHHWQPAVTDTCDFNSSIEDSCSSQVQPPCGLQQDVWPVVNTTQVAQFGSERLKLMTTVNPLTSKFQWQYEVCAPWDSVCQISSFYNLVMRTQARNGSWTRYNE